MINLKADPPRGVVPTAHDASRLRHLRVIPSEPLRPFVEHFWIVAWSLEEGVSHQVETLPHPSVHVTVEPGRSGVGGVRHARFERLLQGESRVFGIKFRPGGFYPFLKSSVAALSETIVPLAHCFGADGAAYEATMIRTDTDDARVALAELFLMERLPKRDAEVDQITALVERTVGDRVVTRVEQLADESGLSIRTLQRRFTRFVGVSPKWVIQRYRLHDAMTRVAQGDAVNWSTLALELGYFDQPHFIRDFKALVGRTPAEYAAHCDRLLRQATIARGAGDQSGTTPTLLENPE